MNEKSCADQVSTYSQSYKDHCPRAARILTTGSNGGLRHLIRDLVILSLVSLPWRLLKGVQGREGSRKCAELTRLSQI
jgi:hypothetical protein